jgi:hypothetical protein
MTTFDEDLLAWLGDEPPSVRDADAERIRQIAAGLAKPHRWQSAIRSSPTSRRERARMDRAAFKREASFTTSHQPKAVR